MNVIMIMNTKKSAYMIISQNIDFGNDLCSARAYKSYVHFDIDNVC